MDTQYVSVAEAARKLGKSDRAVRQWIASGKLEAERNGRSWRILASSLRNGSQSEVDFPITAHMQSEIDHLRSEVAEKNRQLESQAQQIDRFQQLLAMQTKITAALTERMHMIEDLRRRKLPLLKRIFRWT